MRIARVLTRLNLGGPARQSLASDTILTARGHDVRIFTGRAQPGEGDLFATFERRGLDVRRVPGLARGFAGLGELRAARFLRAELLAYRPEVLHTHASKAGWLGRRAARRLPGLIRVHTFHGHVLEGYFGGVISRALILSERRLARHTERLVAVSHATADDLVRLGVSEEKRLVVVPPGVELDELCAIEGPSGELRALVGAGSEVFLVGVIGRLAEVKRPEWALEVFALLAPRHPRLELVFVGDGDRRRILERAIEALPPELARRVHLVGVRADMPVVLADLDGVLSTSRSEGLPVALIEAAAAGLPVVATPVGGVPEVVVHERTGFLGETPDELAYGLAQLLERPEGAREMGRRARLRVAARHGAVALADRLEELYRALLEEHTCAS